MKHLIALLVGLSWSSTAHAETLPPSHDLYHEYYQYWYNGRGTHCCDERHCRPANASDFKWQNGRWYVNLNNHWRPIVGTDYVVDDGGLGPFGSICAEGSHLYCVDLPDAQF